MHMTECAQAHVLVYILGGNWNAAMVEVFIFNNSSIVYMPRSGTLKERSRTATHTATATATATQTQPHRHSHTDTHTHTRADTLVQVECLGGAWSVHDA